MTAPPELPKSRNELRKVEIRANKAVAEQQFRATLSLSLAALSLVVTLNFTSGDDRWSLLGSGAAIVLLLIATWTMLQRHREAEREVDAKCALVDLDEAEEKAKAAKAKAKAAKAKAKAAKAKAKAKLKKNVKKEVRKGVNRAAVDGSMHPARTKEVERLALSAPVDHDPAILSKPSEEAVPNRA